MDFFFSREGVAQISPSVAAPVGARQSPTFWQPHSPLQIDMNSWAATQQGRERLQNSFRAI